MFLESYFIYAGFERIYVLLRGMAIVVVVVVGGVGVMDGDDEAEWGTVLVVEVVAEEGDVGEVVDIVFVVV